MEIKAPNLSKLLWILVLCRSIWGLGYYVSENYIKLKIDPEVLVKAQYINSRSIPFPALTICPPFPVKTEFLNVSKLFEDLQNGISPKLEDKKIITTFTQVCVRWFWDMAQFKNEANDSENIVEMIHKMSPKIEEIFDYCTLSDKTECKKLLIRSLTFYGNCFTFNLVGYHSIFNSNISAEFDGYKRKNITKSWNISDVLALEYYDDEKYTEPSNWTIHKGCTSDDDWVQPLRASGLQNCIFITKIKPTERSNFCETAFNSHRVFLHLPNEIPTFSNVYTTIPVGHFKYMRISAEIKKTDESLKSYSPAYRKCYFEDERQLKFLKSYTKFNCELECMTNFTYKICGCVAYWMPRYDDMQVCKFSKSPCYRNIFYRWSSSYYANSDNKLNFPNFPCNCLPTCTRIKYSIVNEFSAVRTQRRLIYT